MVNLESESIFHSSFPFAFVDDLTFFEESSSSRSESFKERADVLFGIIFAVVDGFHSHSLFEALEKTALVRSFLCIHLGPFIRFEHLQLII